MADRFAVRTSPDGEYTIEHSAFRLNAAIQPPSIVG